MLYSIYIFLNSVGIINRGFVLYYHGCPSAFALMQSIK